MDMYDRIDELLKEKNISRRKLAIMAGVPPTTLQSAFSRKTVNLSHDTIKKIADALGVPVADLAGWSYPYNVDQEALNEMMQRLMESVKIIIEEISRMMDNLLDALNDSKDEIYKTVMVNMLMEHLSHMGG